MLNTIPDERLTRYLLGAELSESEQDDIEQRYFADDAFLEQLEAIEMGLIVRYLRDDLSPEERDLFENRFLLAPERRESLQFLGKLFPESRRISENVGAVAMAPATAVPAEPGPSTPWWKSLASLLSIQQWTLQSAFAAAAAVLLVGVLSLWSVSRTNRLERELAALRDENVALHQQVDRQESAVQVARQLDQNGSARQMFYAGRFQATASTTTLSATGRELVSAAPLGVRYRLFKTGSQGEDIAVDADGPFGSTDRIRVSLEVNNTGYLYVLGQQSGGRWSVLFPSGANNPVKPAELYAVPTSSGIDKVFVVFSRQAERDLDAFTKSADNAAMNKIYEGMQARDQVIEKEVLEKALYAVSTRPSADTRVVLDLNLKHQ